MVSWAPCTPPAREATCPVHPRDSQFDEAHGRCGETRRTPGVEGTDLPDTLEEQDADLEARFAELERQMASSFRKGNYRG